MKEKDRQEDLKVESLEDQVREINNSIFHMIDKLLPPKELREEVKKQIYTAQLSMLKAIKAIIDYKVSQLENKVEGKPTKKEKTKKIEVE